MARSSTRINRNLRVVPKTGLKKSLRKLLGGGRVLSGWTEECPPSNAGDVKEEDVESAMADSDTYTSLLEVARSSPSYGGGFRHSSPSVFIRPRFPLPPYHLLLASSARLPSALRTDSTSDTLSDKVVMTSDASTQTESHTQSPEEQLLAECDEMMEGQLVESMEMLVKMKKMLRRKI